MNPKNQKSTSSKTLKVQLTIDVEYDLIPNRKNKIDITKMIALELFRLGDGQNLSYEDVKVLNYNFHINTNPYNKKQNYYKNKNKQQTKEKQ